MNLRSRASTRRVEATKPCRTHHPGFIDADGPPEESRREQHREMHGEIGGNLKN
jgi:hypothetical protein